MTWITIQTMHNSGGKLVRSDQLIPELDHNSGIRWYLHVIPLLNISMQNEQIRFLSPPVLSVRLSVCQSVCPSGTKTRKKVTGKNSFQRLNTIEIPEL